MLPKKRNNAQILLKNQESAQECWKCKIVLQIRKSAQRSRDCPNIRGGRGGGGGGGSDTGTGSERGNGAGSCGSGGGCSGSGRSSS